MVPLRKRFRTIAPVHRFTSSRSHLLAANSGAGVAVSCHASCLRPSRCATHRLSLRSSNQYLEVPPSDYLTCKPGPNPDPPPPRWFGWLSGTRSCRGHRPVQQASALRKKTGSPKPLSILNPESMYHCLMGNDSIHLEEIERRQATGGVAVVIDRRSRVTCEIPFATLQLRVSSPNFPLPHRFPSIIFNPNAQNPLRALA